jgi:outer membrane protein OmpA-like peptidoglycan-associated protein
MRRSSGSDHLAHSFTDLMTSLMVIFILLLLVFVNNQASVNSVTTQSLMVQLREQLEPAGFKREDIRIDPKDPSTILLTVLDNQLTFEPNSHQLEPQGEKFLQTRMPKLTETLCAPQYRDAIEAVIVEGHSDNAPYRGLTLEESQARNLQLSQERSMEVVEKTLTSLSGEPRLRSCLLDKISASGRGEQGLAETGDKSRRAVIKVRVNATHAVDLANAIVAEKIPMPHAAPLATPATARILDVLSRLGASPRQPVRFRLSDDEVNQYIRYSLLRTPRSGIDSVAVKFFPHNYVSTLTVIDFDALEHWSPGLVPGFLDLNGKKALWIDVRFTVDHGTLGYKIEKVFYQNKPLPHMLAEKIIQVIGSRQPENAGGQEMPVPFALQRIETGEHYVEAEN